MGAGVDHLVFAAASLDEGAAALEAAFGVPFSPGGQHLTMGTHNRLLRIGEDVYLEVIAIDPSLPAPGHPRWFGLDEPAMRERLRDGPQLITWIARSPCIASAAAFFQGFGQPTQLSRGDLSWTITLTPGGGLIEDGVLPQLISWAGASPPERLPDRGVGLSALRLFHPQADLIAEILAAAGFDPVAPALVLKAGLRPEIVADFDTPLGPRTFSSLEAGWRQHRIAGHQPGGREAREP